MPGEDVAVTMALSSTGLTPPPSQEEWEAAMADQRIVEYGSPECHALGADDMVHVYAQLEKLREQFPAERIEKLPRPLWKGAWDGETAGNCKECHGRHVLTNVIHLDYVGHANVTDRLLSVDPLWEWEPMALTEQGTPLFTDGGLWIRLTVCGVTRLGFGDGKSIKEVIGDAIRNAAMRFGVGLDLWAKISLHEERNPGDGATPRQERSAGVEHGGRAAGQGRGRGAVSAEASPEPSRRPNQDALDSLKSVCDEFGYAEQYCIDRYAAENKQAHIANAKPEDVMAFAAKLIEEATPEPDGGDAGAGVPERGQAEPDADGVSAGHGGVGSSAGSEDATGNAAPVEAVSDGAGDDGVASDGGDGVDTSDVEKKPEDLF